MYIVKGLDLLQVFLEFLRLRKVRITLIKRNVIGIIPFVFPLKPEITIYWQE